MPGFAAEGAGAEAGRRTCRRAGAEGPRREGTAAGGGARPWDRCHGKGRARGRGGVARPDVPGRVEEAAPWPSAGAAGGRCCWPGCRPVSEGRAGEAAVAAGSRSPPGPLPAPGHPCGTGGRGPGGAVRICPGLTWGGGERRRRPRGERKGWPGPGERCFPPLVSFPGGRKSGAFPRWVRKPCGEEFRYPKGAASCSPRRKWPLASWQPPVSLVCGRLGLDRSTGCKHKGVPLWLVRSAHPSLCC